MPPEFGQSRTADAVVRALAAAAKSLRLYPPTSPIPAQSVESAIQALNAFFSEGAPSLSLTVAREGFSWEGQPVAASVMGVAELVQDLREHGVAEVDIAPTCTGNEILGFLTAVLDEPESVRDRGGISAVTEAAGVSSIRVVDVRLTVAEMVGPGEGEDFEEFLRNLAKDPEKLAAWFAAASKGDPKAFEESLMELVRVSGPSGYQDMLSALSAAFANQDHDAKDALLGLAIEKGPTRDLTGSMFGMLSSSDIAGSIVGGAFGRNMLSLSTALTKLPLEDVTAQVRAEVQAMLPGQGHTNKEADFLHHMIDVRERKDPEPALADADGTYRQVLDTTKLDEEAIRQAREAVQSSQGFVSAAGVRTILRLLDQQQNFELYCNSVNSLAHMVPKLIEQGDLALAKKVLGELSRRESLEVGPWPDLSRRMQEALAAAAGPQSMAALVSAVTADPSRLSEAKEMMLFAGEPGHAALVSAAIQLKGPGLEMAEHLIGRRLLDMLAAQAAGVEWFQVGPIAARLAREGDARSVQVLQNLLSKGDEQSRREVVSAIAETGGPAASRLLAAALRDANAEVAATAARAIGKAAKPGSAVIITARLDELDIDTSGFALARELIAALARLPEAEAGQALEKLGARKALIKRGHFTEIQDLVAQALQYRQRGGAR
jgi:hypothetical protein